MLTLDLLRYRVDGDAVTPVYLTITGGRKYLDIAERLVEMFRCCLGKTVGELDEEIEDAFGGGIDYKVYRGLAKMMGDYMETAPPVEVDAGEIDGGQCDVGNPPDARADEIDHGLKRSGSEIGTDQPLVRCGVPGVDADGGGDGPCAGSAKKATYSDNLCI
jgi:predicted nuclease of restriction endonuclease-like RecB superfamily